MYGARPNPASLSASESHHLQDERASVSIGLGGGGFWQEYLPPLTDQSPSVLLVLLVRRRAGGFFYFKLPLASVDDMYVCMYVSVYAGI